MSWSFPVPPPKNLSVHFITFTALFHSSIPAAPLTPILVEESSHFGLTGAVTELVPAVHWAGASSWMGAG